MSGTISAVYKLSPPTLSDKDTSPLLLDNAGNLKVVQSGTPVAARSEFVDDSKFTPGTDYVGMMGAQADETGSDSVDEGDAGALRMSLKRALYVQLDADAATNGVVKQDDVSTFTPGVGFGVPVGGQVDDTGTDTADEGDFVVARFTARRAQAINLDTKIAGEDQTNDVLKVEGQFTGVSCTADTQVKASAGFLHTITVYCNDSAPTAGSNIVYDNTAESGTEIIRFEISTTFFNPINIVLDRICTTGIYVGFTTTADVRVQVTYR